MVMTKNRRYSTARVRVCSTHSLFASTPEEVIFGI